MEKHFSVTLEVIIANQVKYVKQSVQGFGHRAKNYRGLCDMEEDKEDLCLSQSE